nr:MAG TPA: hypothetical protein [Caudoviricetes sp.]
MRIFDTTLPPKLFQPTPQPPQDFENSRKEKGARGGMQGAFPSTKIASPSSSESDFSVVEKNARRAGKCG